MTALKDIEDSIRYSCRKMPDYGDALIKKVRDAFEIKAELDDIRNMVNTSEYKHSGEFAKIINDRLIKLLKVEQQFPNEVKHE